MREADGPSRRRRREAGLARRCIRARPWCAVGVWGLADTIVGLAGLGLAVVLAGMLAPSWPGSWTFRPEAGPELDPCSQAADRQHYHRSFRRANRWSPQGQSCWVRSAFAAVLFALQQASASSIEHARLSSQSPTAAPATASMHAPYPPSSAVFRMLARRAEQASPHDRAFPIPSWFRAAFSGCDVA